MGSVIPVMRPRLPRLDEVAPWIRRIDETQIYSNFGPLVRELEASHARRLQVPAERVVSVANATLGLVGAITLTQATQWVVPDFTFPASAQAVLSAGRHLILGDVRAADWQLDVTGLMDRTHDEALGIMPVMPFGADIQLEPWSAFTTVVIDAAASLGANRIDLSQLPSAWAVVFSLHATKVQPAGEGGLVVFGDAQAAERFRAWSNFGFAGTRLSAILGTNAKMSETTAAYGLASLAAWPTEQSDWRESLDLANALTTGLGLATPVQQYAGVHPYWIARFANIDQRDQAVRFLSDQQVETRLWWPAPLHEMPAFQNLQAAQPTPIARHLADTVIGLPMYRGLRPEQIQRIGQLLRELADASGTRSGGDRD